MFWGVLENRICQFHFQKHPLHVPKRRAKEGAAAEVEKNFLSKLAPPSPPPFMELLQLSLSNIHAAIKRKAK